mmetsp:Transcript_12404/g.16279  ORF Transcript_12404/g.16279 Transcript_12404/m.16279 type:complete len:212 (+) Transcript_12404:288-923(+)
MVFTIPFLLLPFPLVAGQLHTILLLTLPFVGHPNHTIHLVVPTEFPPLSLVVEIGVLRAAPVELTQVSPNNHHPLPFVFGTKEPLLASWMVIGRHLIAPFNPAGFQVLALDEDHPLTGMGFAIFPHSFPREVMCGGLEAIRGPANRSVHVNHVGQLVVQAIDPQGLPSIVEIRLLGTLRVEAGISTFLNHPILLVIFTVLATGFPSGFILK